MLVPNGHAARFVVESLDVTMACLGYGCILAATYPRKKRRLLDKVGHSVLFLGAVVTALALSLA